MVQVPVKTVGGVVGTDVGVVGTDVGVVGTDVGEVCMDVGVSTRGTVTWAVVLLHWYIAVSVTITSFLVKTRNKVLSTFPINVSFWQSAFGQERVYRVTLALLFHRSPTKRLSLKNREEVKNLKPSKGKIIGRSKMQTNNNNNLKNSTSHKSAEGGT